MYFLAIVRFRPVLGIYRYVSFGHFGQKWDIDFCDSGLKLGMSFALYF